MLGVTLGIGVVLTLLLTAAHLLTHLYATSVVTAAGYDAAVEAAAHGGNVPAAEARARQTLGGLAERTTFDWSASNEDEVVLRVHLTRPALVPARYATTLGLDEIERELRVRVERFR